MHLASSIHGILRDNCNVDNFKYCSAFEWRYKLCPGIYKLRLVLFSFYGVKRYILRFTSITFRCPVRIFISHRPLFLGFRDFFSVSLNAKNSRTCDLVSQPLFLDESIFLYSSISYVTAISPGGKWQCSLRCYRANFKRLTFSTQH